MATPLGAAVGPEQLTAFGRGRQSLKESVWYSGHLLTFLATGEDTQGRFALIEIVGRKGNVPLRTSTTAKTKPSTFLRARCPLR